MSPAVPSKAIGTGFKQVYMLIESISFYFIASLVMYLDGDFLKQAFGVFWNSY